MSPSASLWLWRSLAEPPPPRQVFCTHLTTPWQNPSSLGRDAQPVGFPEAPSGHACPMHSMSPALCPQDKVSPPPATLAPCLQLEASPLAPGCSIVLGCPPSPLSSQSLHCSSLPTALKHHGQRCFSRASSWDGAQGERYFALAKTFRPAGPGRCAGKRGLRARVVVPTAAQGTLSRLSCAGQTLLSLTHPARAHGAASGHCLSAYPRLCLSQQPNPPGGAPQRSPQAAPAPPLSGACRTPAGRGSPGCAVTSTTLLTPRSFPAGLSQGAVGGRNRGERWRCFSLPPAPGRLVTVGEQRGHPRRAPRGGGACGQRGRERHAGLASGQPCSAPADFALLFFGQGSTHALSAPWCPSPWPLGSVRLVEAPEARG